jgi:peptidoglycan/xylan/chitin deacetylase (PgdA/CDA1 family)
VGAVLAADISATALERAKGRCAGLSNVEFLRLNFRSEPLPPGDFDLIVCSEVLYFLNDRFELHRIARKFARGLRPGGHLLMAHANVVVDDPATTGWDWPVGFGVKRIGESFAGVRDLEFVRELRTPVYRVQLFRRSLGRLPVVRPRVPREVTEAPSAAEPGRSIHWGGCALGRGEAANAWTTRALPILMYHRIASDAPDELARYRISPERFERQLAYLRRHGYAGILLDEWIDALARSDGRLPGRLVAITFDDAYRDFLTEAWPLLKKYCFRATVFVPTDHVGGRAEWDSTFGRPAPLLSWDEIRALAAEGVAFGAHGGSHDYLGRLDLRAIVAEGQRSRARLEQELGRPVTTMSYPFGDHDERVRLAMSFCGFRCAVTTEPGPSRLGDKAMALPRQEVRGDEDFEAFIAKLGRPERATIDRRLRYRWSRLIGRNLQ